MGISNTDNEVLTQFTHDAFHVGITKIVFHYKNQQK